MKKLKPTQYRISYGLAEHLLATMQKSPNWASTSYGFDHPQSDKALRAISVSLMPGLYQRLASAKNKVNVGDMVKVSLQDYEVYPLYVVSMYAQISEDTAEHLERNALASQLFKKFI